MLCRDKKVVIYMKLFKREVYILSMVRKLIVLLIFLVGGIFNFFIFNIFRSSIEIGMKLLVVVVIWFSILV